MGLQDVWLEGVKLDKQVVCNKIKKITKCLFRLIQDHGATIQDFSGPVPQLSFNAAF